VIPSGWVPSTGMATAVSFMPEKPGGGGGVFFFFFNLGEIRIGVVLPETGNHLGRIAARAFALDRRCAQIPLQPGRNPSHAQNPPWRGSMNGRVPVLTGQWAAKGSPDQAAVFQPIVRYGQPYRPDHGPALAARPDLAKRTAQSQDESDSPDA